MMVSFQRKPRMASFIDMPSGSLGLAGTVTRSLPIISTNTRASTAGTSAHKNVFEMESAKEAVICSRTFGGVGPSLQVKAQHLHLTRHRPRVSSGFRESAVEAVALDNPEDRNPHRHAEGAKEGVR